MDFETYPNSDGQNSQQRAGNRHVGSRLYRRTNVKLLPSINRSLDHYKAVRLTGVTYRENADKRSVPGCDSRLTGLETTTVKLIQQQRWIG